MGNVFYFFYRSDNICTSVDVAAHCVCIIALIMYLLNASVAISGVRFALGRSEGAQQAPAKALYL